MTSEQAIEDLKALKQYFIDTMCVEPMCLDFAIKAIEQPKCICSRECTWKQDNVWK